MNPEPPASPWKIPPQVFENLGQEMAAIVFDEARSERYRIAAAKVLLSMNSQNSPAPLVSVTLNRTGETVAALLQEPDYLRFLQNEAGG
jgi:hypothetical protein